MLRSWAGKLCFLRLTAVSAEKSCADSRGVIRSGTPIRAVQILWIG